MKMARSLPTCGVVIPRDACIQQKLLPSAENIDLEDCEGAIDDEKLKVCVQQIRHGQCGTGIARIVACAHDNICPGVSQEGTT